MMVDTVIDGGRIVTPHRTFHGSVAIDDGEIVGITDPGGAPSADRTIDATDRLILPGVVDPHVHIDALLPERAGDYQTETAAAARGGVTTVIDFAWQGGDRRLADPDATLLDGIAHKREQTAKAHIDTSVHGVLHRDDPATFDAVADAVDAGVTSFKMFRSTYDSGVDTGFLVDAFEAIAEQDAVALVHAEDPEVCDRHAARAREAGRTAATEYPATRPDYSEAMALDSALHLARVAGVKYYAVHTTARLSAATLARFQTDRSRVRGETCTHYTVLDESAHERQGNLPKIAPPLRTPDDIEAMFERLRDETLSVVSTDHVPFPRAAKETDTWWDAAFGCNSLQRSLPLFHEAAVVQRGHSLPFLVRKMCANPADTFGLPQKGTLEPGTDADIVIFDPERTQEISADTNASAADYSIYEGRTVHGAVDAVFLRGNRIVANGQLVGDPGDGEFLERSIPDWDA
ncbi:MAG: dihydroorotase family protein [Salinirussus sp.]